MTLIHYAWTRLCVNYQQAVGRHLHTKICPQSSMWLFNYTHKFLVKVEMYTVFSIAFSLKDIEALFQLTK